MPICTGTYALGATSGSVTALDYPPRSTLGRQMLGTDMTGAPVHSSFTEVAWSWPVLPQDAYDWLFEQWELSLSGTYSGLVWFRTRSERGTPDFEYDLYLGRMQRPTSDVRQWINRTNVVVRFTRVERMP